MHQDEPDPPQPSRCERSPPAPVSHSLFNHLSNMLLTWQHQSGADAMPRWPVGGVPIAPASSVIGCNKHCP